MVMMVGVQTHVIGTKASLSKIRALIRAELIRAGVRPSGAFDCLVAITEAATIALINFKSAGSDIPRPRVGWEIDFETARFYLEDFSARDWHKIDGTPEFQKLHESLHELGVDHPGMTALEGLMDVVEIDLDLEKGFTRVLLVKKLR